MNLVDHDKVFSLLSQHGSKATPGDYVRSLESGLPSCERNKRWIMVLQAYIDDSGTGSIKREPFMALAGFISTAEKWANFSDEWQKELDKDPPIKCFKMRHAFHKIGPFDGLSNDDIGKRIKRFIEIINAYALIRVSSTMDKREYSNFVKNEVALIENPFSLCFQYLIMETISYQWRNKWKHSIDYIFDEEGKLGIENVRWLAQLKKFVPKSATPYFGSIIFGDDERLLPLQAADLYAWSIRRHLFENKLIYMPMREELKALQNMPNLEHHVNFTELSKYAEHIWIDEIRNTLKSFKKNRK